ncbi:MAG: protein tyrosine phosphatase family protein [Vicinamibacterales bacterium]
MHTRVATFCLLFLLNAFPLAETVRAFDDAPAVPIKRFLKLDDGLYRGGQPDHDGYRYLRDLGVDTVISLRNDTKERAFVESLGMRWVHIPVTFRPFGWGDDLSADDVERFFAVLDDPSSGTIFFHCQRGADRTGTFAGIYRMVRQGWDLDRAYGEARDMGMRWWYFHVKGRMADYARELLPLATAQ